MPMYNVPLRRLDENEVRRYAGLRAGADFPDELVAQAADTALLLAKPRGIWETYDYDPNRQGAGGAALFTGGVAKHLTGAVKITVMAVTIGTALEERSAALFAQGDYTAALLLDAAGSAAAEEVADAVNRLIREEAVRQGYDTLRRFSPGYGGWEVSVQRDILALAGGEVIGVAVTASSMLLPRKSVTAVVGWTPRGEAGCRQENAASCAECGQANCLARRVGKA